MFKKLMEVPDLLIIKYFELAIDEHPTAIQQIARRLADGENPRDIKIELAEIIVALYHGQEQMVTAKAYFEAAFQRRKIPANIPTMLLESEQMTLQEVVPH